VSTASLRAYVSYLLKYALSGVVAWEKKRKKESEEEKKGFRV
jgi:hypothetical protein